MADRRTTLGPISQSTLNSRMSMGRPSIGATLGPSRVSTAPMEGYPTKAPRQSIGGNAAMPPSGRRSSVGIATTAPRKSSLNGRMSSIGTSARMSTDPRNIGDKMFMQNSIKTLIAYLLENGFDHQISLKILTRPAVKDFSNIVAFLFRQVDPTYTNPGKLEDDVVLWFKQLGYPFQISKSHITAVGSPHAWPSLLGCLMWMIELLSYDQAANIGGYINPSAPLNSLANTDDDEDDNEDEMDNEGSHASSKTFYKYIAMAYKLFLSGNDIEYNTLEDSFTQVFDNKNLLILDDITHIETKIKHMENEISELERKRKILPELENKKRDYMNDFGKFEYLLDNLNKHKEQLLSKKVSREAELSKINEAIHSIMQENMILRDRIAHQELTPEDVRNMISERERLLEAQQAASEMRQQLQRRVWETETSLRDKVQALEDTARTYNAIGEDLKLIPINAKNSRGINFHIEVDIKTKKRNTLLKTDIKNNILPYINDMILSLKELVSTRKNEYDNVYESLEEMEQKLNDTNISKNELESKLKKIEDYYKNEKDMYEHSCELHRKEMDTIEMKLNKIRDTSADETRYATSMRRLSELKALYTSRRNAYDIYKREMLESVLNVATIAANHREYAQKSINEVKEQYSNQLHQFFVQSNNPNTHVLKSSKKIDHAHTHHNHSSSSSNAMGTTTKMTNGAIPDMLSPINMQIDENQTRRFRESQYGQGKVVYNLTGLINECAKNDHNLLDDSIQIDLCDM